MEGFIINTLFEQNGYNYEIQGDFHLLCIATKEQNELQAACGQTDTDNTLNNIIA
ncbi:MAG: hypothetical protein SOX70_03115 [Peptoniphilaceae bacterium]|nr:hypothetical protein [Peptoniphilaceae bacterium]